MYFFKFVMAINFQTKLELFFKFDKKTRERISVQETEHNAALIFDYCQKPIIFKISWQTYFLSTAGT